MRKIHVATDRWPLCPVRMGTTGPDSQLVPPFPRIASTLLAKATRVVGAVKRGPGYN